MTQTKKCTALITVLMVMLMLVSVFATMPKLQAADEALAIPVTKAITGGTPTTAETFTFNIAAHEQTDDAAQVLDAPLPASTTCTVSGAGDTAFGGITYTIPGRYYYDITETAGTNPEYAYDTDTYIVCVEVKNDPAGGLTSSIVAIWKNTIVNEVSAKLPKVEFSNTFTATVPGSLTLSKTVTGELGNKKLDFEFTVTFSDTAYTFDAGAMGKIENGSGAIKLKHGESVTFTGLTANTTYTITEKNGEAYTTTVDNNGTAVTGKEVTGTVARNASVNVAYTNDLPYTPIVGLNMNSLPFILLGVFSLSALGFLSLRKRRETTNG